MREIAPAQAGAIRLVPFPSPPQGAGDALAVVDGDDQPAPEEVEDPKRNKDPCDMGTATSFRDEEQGYEAEIEPGNDKL